MKIEDAEEYTQSLGQIHAGSWRQTALAVRLGVPQALGLSIEDWVQRRLGGYIRLGIPGRREAVAELAAEGMSQRGIAGVLGVDQATVQRDLRDANASPEPEEPAPLLDSTDERDANASPHKPHLSQNTGNDEWMSQRGIAGVLGVDQATVQRDLRDANAKPQHPTYIRLSQPWTSVNESLYSRQPVSALPLLSPS